jgi:hypothetical protein
VPDDVAAGAVVELATDFLPDGSVRIRRGLPIEVVRQALDGPRPVTPAWDGAGAAAEPVTFVVDARNLDVRPRVGIAVTDGTTTTRLPALWRSKPPKGARAVKASGYDEAAGALEVDRVPDAGALLIVVIREEG